MGLVLKRWLMAIARSANGTDNMNIERIGQIHIHARTSHAAIPVEPLHTLASVGLVGANKRALKSDSHISYLFFVYFNGLKDSFA